MLPEKINNINAQKYVQSNFDSYDENFMISLYENLHEKSNITENHRHFFKLSTSNMRFS